MTRTIPAPPVTRWKNLPDLEFFYPDYWTPARVDVMLKGKLFSRTVLHGWQFGPLGTPSAINTRFGWVLNGKVKNKGVHIVLHMSAVLPPKLMGYGDFLICTTLLGHYNKITCSSYPTHACWKLTHSNVINLIISRLRRSRVVLHVFLAPILCG